MQYLEMTNAHTITQAYIRLILLSTSCLLMVSAVVLLSLLRNSRNDEAKRRNILLSETNTAGPNSKQFKTTPKKRRWWVAPGRTDKWWMNMWNGEAIAEEWIKNFRIPKEQFNALADELSPYISPDPSSPRMGLSVEKKLAITLHLLKDTGSITVTANAFGVSAPTVSKTIRSVCYAINTHLGARYLKVPRGIDLKESVNLFQERFGFPQVLGAVDGTHIEINKPTEDSQSYFSYKMKYSLNVQAVCDATGKFLDVDIRWPGGTHDAKVFANSHINKAMQEGRISKLYRALLPGRNKVPLLLLADPAYPLLPHCMKEYSTCYNNGQVMFNTMLRSARNPIECAFGRLKARWQILTRCLNFNLDDIPVIVYACFVLHYYCEINKVPIDEIAVASIQQTHVDESQTSADRRYSITTTQGVKTREVVTDYFKDYMVTE